MAAASTADELKEQLAARHGEALHLRADQRKLRHDLEQHRLAHTPALLQLQVQAGGAAAKLDELARLLDAILEVESEDRIVDPYVGEGEVVGQAAVVCSPREAFQQLDGLNSEIFALRMSVQQLREQRKKFFRRVKTLRNHIRDGKCDDCAHLLSSITQVLQTLGVGEGVRGACVSDMDRLGDDSPTACDVISQDTLQSATSARLQNADVLQDQPALASPEHGRKPEQLQVEALPPTGPSADSAGAATLLWPTPRALGPRAWTADTPGCQLCKQAFCWLSRRRHHCRMCGRCVCADCSPFRVPLRRPLRRPSSNGGGSVEPLVHRACRDCLPCLDGWQAPAAAEPQADF